jgi:DNA-binding protein HU-beta/integration host factor subunit alpha
MTKRELVTRISNDTGLTQTDVIAVVQKTFDCIIESMVKNETIELRNFGVFEVRLRKPRIGRNPNVPGKDVAIPARAVVKFTPGKEMRERVLSLTPTIVPQ